jgi:hypothetical protein
MHTLGGTRVRPMSYPKEIRREALLKRYALTLAIITVIGSASLAASERWTDQRDPQFGFSYSFPDTLFASVEGDGKLGSIISLPISWMLSFSSVPGIIEMMGLQNISNAG